MQNLYNLKNYTKVILCVVGGQMLQCKVFSCEMSGGQVFLTLLEVVIWTPKFTILYT